ncbi:hypothetical protein HYH02_000440 [Chlamydomonas schloesseri]|uniref:Uncharacterized protein n=1 Tax=Chlamydomonas schloesseri TaxID=2026947 RepID=A0A836BDB7_9CHLO|nr:hypothetical protein HYH02_000440 [Chlamydomonas schloesseri]|eukprot:KAG2454599.1 hypothetical protein HYH02_000440 [Chlamydomonas schloesseri]
MERSEEGREWSEVEERGRAPCSRPLRSDEDGCASLQRSPSLLELELRSQAAVWGQSTTPSMQKLECIQKVKRELVQAQSEADSIPAFAFSMMVLLSVAAAASIVLVWELYFRPRNNAAALA